MPALDMFPETYATVTFTNAVYQQWLITLMGKIK